MLSNTKIRLNDFTGKVAMQEELHVSSENLLVNWYVRTCIQELEQGEARTTSMVVLISKLVSEFRESIFRRAFCCFRRSAGNEPRTFCNVAFLRGGMFGAYAEMSEVCTVPAGTDRYSVPGTAAGTATGTVALMYEPSLPVIFQLYIHMCNVL